MQDWSAPTLKHVGTYIVPTGITAILIYKQISAIKCPCKQCVHYNNAYRSEPFCEQSIRRYLHHAYNTTYHNATVTQCIYIYYNEQHPEPALKPVYYCFLYYNMRWLTSKNARLRPWAFRLFSSLMGKTLGGVRTMAQEKERESERKRARREHAMKKKNLFSTSQSAFVKSSARAHANVPIIRFKNQKSEQLRVPRPPRR